MPPTGFDTEEEYEREAFDAYCAEQESLDAAEVAP